MERKRVGKKTILGISIFTGIFILLVTLGLTSYFSTQSTLDRVILDRLIAQSRQQEAKMVDILDSRAKFVRSIAREWLIIEALLNNESETLKNLLEPYSQELESFENLYIYKIAAEVSIMATNQINSTPVDKPAFADHVASARLGKAHFSLPFVLPTSKLAAMLVTVPIKYEHKVVGMVGLIFGLPETVSIHNRDFSLEKTRYIFLTVNDGLAFTLSGTTPSKLLSSSPGTLIRNIRPGENRALTFRKHAKYRFLTISSMKESKIDGYLDETLRHLLLAGFFILAVVGLVLPVILSRLRDPLLKTKTKISKQVSGNFQLGVGNYRRDEHVPTPQHGNGLTKKTQHLISHMVRIMESARDGNFSRQISSGQTGQLSKLRNSINQSLVTFSNTIFKVRNISNQLYSSALEINQSSSMLNLGMANQVNHLENFDTAVETMEQNAIKFREDLAKAKHHADQATLEIKANWFGIQRLKKTLERIDANEINAAQVIKLFEEIALQIKLVAINTTIKASHNQDSDKVYQEIAPQLSRISTCCTLALHEIRKQFETTAKELKAGVQISEKALQTQINCEQHIREVSDSFENIPKIFTGQYHEIIRRSLKLADVKSFIQQYSSFAAVADLAAKELTNQTRQLFQLLEKFRLLPAEKKSNQPSTKTDEGEVPSAENKSIDPAENSSAEVEQQDDSRYLKYFEYEN